MRRAACAFVGGHGGAVVGGAFGAGSGFRVGECTVEGGGVKLYLDFGRDTGHWAVIL